MADDGADGLKKKLFDEDRPPPIPPRPSFTFANRSHPQPLNTVRSDADQLTGHCTTDPHQPSTSQQPDLPTDTSGATPSQATTSDGRATTADDLVDSTGEDAAPVPAGTVSSPVATSGVGEKTVDNDADSMGNVTAAVPRDTASKGMAAGGGVENVLDNADSGTATPFQLTPSDGVKIADADVDSSEKPAAALGPLETLSSGGIKIIDDSDVDGSGKPAPVPPPRLKSKKSADDLTVVDRTLQDDETSVNEAAAVGEALVETPAQHETSADVTSCDNDLLPSSAAVCDDVFLPGSEDATNTQDTEGTEMMELARDKGLTESEATETEPSDNKLYTDTDIASSPVLREYQHRASDRSHGNSETASADMSEQLHEREQDAGFSSNSTTTRLNSLSPDVITESTADTRSSEDQLPVVVDSVVVDAELSTKAWLPSNATHATQRTPTRVF